MDHGAKQLRLPHAEGPRGHRAPVSSLAQSLEGKCVWCDFSGLADRRGYLGFTGRYAHTGAHFRHTSALFPKTGNCGAAWPPAPPGNKMMSGKKGHSARPRCRPQSEICSRSFHPPNSRRRRGRRLRIPPSRMAVVGEDGGLGASRAVGVGAQGATPPTGKSVWRRRTK